MNLIAMGAAGHRFGDYWRLGLVVMAVFFVVAVFVVPVFLAVQLSASARGFEPPGDLQAGRRPTPTRASRYPAGHVPQHPPAPPRRG